ncbi:FG-GAP-like repeat-containing protein, partial [Dactylosporangium sp. NPDC051485]|uniref:FG-GAP-like repeat-containing protein n=1 Tax=Dactylosporangium sp. NPDC051485 TaxID=3154846 RepID=UPI00341DFF68
MLSAVLAGSGLATLEHAPPAHAGPPSTHQQQQPVHPEDASARARATGKPVEVASATSPNELTEANPDGTFTTTINPQPVRTRRDGRWVALDATLKQNADGSYSPIASARPLSISNGGGAAFAVIRDGGSELGLKWPGQLPKPAVSGATATYANVLPGVDLAVTASAQGGFSHVLVVHDAAAAANPALRSLRLETVAVGVSLKAGTGGGITAVDHTGRVAFTATAPIAWDSTAPTDAQAKAAGLDGTDPPQQQRSHGEAVHSSVTEPGIAAKRHTVRIDAGADNAITLTTDQAVLQSPDTTYPLYIDPSWNPNSAPASRNAWAYVNSYWSGTSYYNSSDWARAGFAGWESPTYKARSFFQFGIPSNIWGTTIKSATLQLRSVWSATNTAFTFEIYHMCGIGSTTAWSNQPCKGNLITSASLPGNWRANGSYNPMEHDFDVTAEIAAAADGRWSATTLGLFNATETNRDAWRKFENNPTIAITYNATPNTPSNYGTSPSVPCTGGQIGNTAITFSATLSDPDGTQGLLDGEFNVTDTTTGSTIASPTVTVSNDQSASFSLPASTFANGHTYSWAIHATDGDAWSPWSPTCRFTINHNTPAAPQVSSVQYPANTVGAPARTSGTFTFTPTAGSDTPVSYVYSLNVAPPAVIPSGFGPFHGGQLLQAAAGGAPTNVTIAPRRFGPNVLYVYAINGAGNAGTVTAYRFTTAAAAPAPFGDFTGDGKPDLITVGNAGRPGAWLYPGTDANGHLGTPIQVGSAGTGGAGSTGVASDWTGSTVSALDLTGDGAQDLLVKLPRSDADGNVEVIPAYGDGGTFAPEERIKLLLPKVDGSGGNQVVDQITASPLPSITGSPLPDLYAIVGDCLYVYPPSFPPGAFESPVLLGCGWTGKTITAVFKGNDPALFARTDTTGKLQLLTGNTAGGVFAGATGTTTVTYSANGFPATGNPVIAGADINLDGKPDLWVDTRGTTITGNLNAGNNTLAAAVANPTSGKTDIALFHDNGGGHVGLSTLTTHANGDGGLDGPITRWDEPAWGSGTTLTAKGDFNGDGKADIALFHDNGSGHVTLSTLTAHTNGDGGFDDVVNRWDGPFWGYGTKFLATGDFNGDGKTDIALFYDYDTGGHVTLFTLTAHTNGDGGFDGPITRWDGPYWGSGTKFLATGDFNGDGKTDIALFYDYDTGGHVTLFTLTAHT